MTSQNRPVVPGSAAPAHGTLASILAAVIDAETDGLPLLHRREWADILGVSAATLSYWTNGSNVPTPTHLRSILDVARRDERFERALARLEQALDVPLASLLGSARAEEETPARTLRHVLVKPIKDAFLNSLGTLPPAVQERVLFDASRLVREARSKLQETGRQAANPKTS
jgi:transcriptional regulator with XRE-family HTH domain